MAVVSATASAVVLLAGIDHFEIDLRLQCTGDEVEETGLSAAAVVFRGGYKQGQVTASAVVSSFEFLGVQRAGVSVLYPPGTTLGTASASDVFAIWHQTA